MQAFALACGFLFVSLYKGFLGGVNALLFGSFLGITDAQVVVLLVVAVAALLVFAFIGRPLLFASVDAEVAAARGVPVRLLSAVFLVLLGVAAAEVSQITGALLVFALLVMPAAAAQRLTIRPGRSARAVGRHRTASSPGWASAVAYFSVYPIGFYITSFGVRRLRPCRRLADRPPAPRRRATTGRRRSHEPVRRHGPHAQPPVLVHAFLAGTFIALASGLVGYFVVLRRQVFTGDALSHVAFTGALAALAIGIDLRVGLFAACVLFAAGHGRSWAARAGRRRRHRQRLRLGPRPRRALPDDLHDLPQRRQRPGGRQRAVRFDLRALRQARRLAAASSDSRSPSSCWSIARPLLFASIDEAVAAARGVPVRLLGVGFLVLVGITAGEATQAVGSLLLLGLLAAPAGAAHRLTDRPYRAMLAFGRSGGGVDVARARAVLRRPGAAAELRDHVGRRGDLCDRRGNTSSASGADLNGDTLPDN